MRVAAVIVQQGAVALMERRRRGEHYYLFPGGTAEESEAPAEAAAREAFEELGLRVRIGRLLYEVEFAGNLQRYLEADVIGGVFGTGMGEEPASPTDSPPGSYRPVWIALSDLASVDVRPRELATALVGERALRVIQ